MKCEYCILKLSAIILNLWDIKSQYSYMFASLALLNTFYPCSSVPLFYFGKLPVNKGAFYILEMASA